jgi:2-C-methyl-D-erythritol 4-phosphate cytidylyltransferase
LDILENAKNYAKNLYQNKKEEGPFISAVIVAAGSGTRMGEGMNKQFVPLCGIAAVARTISAFESSRLVREIIVVTRKQDLSRMCGVVREFGFSKVTHIVVGGGTRQHSAALGLKVVDVRACFVAVHDGARPLTTAKCIDRVITCALTNGGAASAAVRVKDTVKIADENGMVLSTPDRQRLFAVQTPQVFALPLYRAALDKATQSGADYTDDCQLIEAAGGSVQLVEGEYTNIKITTAEDIPQAEAILRARGDAF